MKIYYAFISDSYVNDFDINYLANFNKRSKYFNDSNYQYLFAIFYENRVLYTVLYDRYIYKSEDKNKVLEASLTFPPGKIYPIAIVYYNPERIIDNFEKEEI